MMVYFSELATAFMTALVLENLLFTRAIDIPSLYEKRTPGQIILIGSVLTGIIAVCSIPSYFLNRFLGSQSSLSRFLTLGLLILNILVFLAAYFLIRRFAPALFARIGGRAAVLRSQLRHPGHADDRLQDQRQLQIFLLLRLLCGGWRQLHRCPAASVVGAPAPGADPRSKGFSRPADHPSVSWHHFSCAVRAAGQSAPGLRRALFREDFYGKTLQD